MPDYPSRVHAGTVKAIFERRPDLYSVRETAGAVSDGAVAVIADDAAAFAVYKGAPPHHRESQEVGPVYSGGPDGPLAVPTGRVFVRFASGIRADERREQIEAAGFEIDKTLSYAPNAVWLRPAAGGVARALPGLGTLGRLPDVEHVEPQLLFERSLKA